MKHKLSKLDIAVIFLSILLIIAELGSLNFFFDIIAHTKPYIILLIAILLLVRLYNKRDRTTVVFAVLLITYSIVEYNRMPLLEGSVSQNGKTIKILHFNLYASNSSYDEVLSMIKMKDPDIISFQEYTSAWHHNLKDKLGGYHLISKPINSPFGIAVATNLNVKSDTISFFNNRRVPFIDMVFDLDGREVNAFFAHPKPPFMPSLYDERNRYFDAMNAYLKNRQNLLLIGDLNITQWSPIYRELVNNLDISNLASPFANTWPNFLPFPVFQIDHVLASDQFRRIEYQVLSDIDSDHYPVYAEVVLVE